MGLDDDMPQGFTPPQGYEPPAPPAPPVPPQDGFAPAPPAGTYPPPPPAGLPTVPQYPSSFQPTPPAEVPFYYSIWFIILAFLVFGLLGFIPLWMSPAVSKKAKTTVTAVLVGLYLLTICGAFAAMATLGGLAGQMESKYDSAASVVADSGTQDPSGPGTVEGKLMASESDVADRIVELSLLGEDGVSTGYLPAATATYTIEGRPATAGEAAALILESGDREYAVTLDLDEDGKFTAAVLTRE